jgi:hypothetical protein
MTFTNLSTRSLDFGGYVVPNVDSLCAESVCDSIDLLTDCSLVAPSNSLNTVASSNDLKVRFLTAIFYNACNVLIVCVKF